MTPSRQSQSITLIDDCPAIRIPSGGPVDLHAGDVVTILQSFGGAVTIQTEMGLLARIAPESARALGLAVERQEATSVPTVNVGPFDIEVVIDQLREVFDPEIPINVVDLGLIYRCDAQPLPGGGHRVDIAMSMTAPGCGMGDILKEDARLRVASVPGVDQVEVELVWDPPWTIARMSEAARLDLGLL